jgi:hypothetical protein
MSNQKEPKLHHASASCRQRLIQVFNNRIQLFAKKLMSFARPPYRENGA